MITFASFGRNIVDGLRFLGEVESRFRFRCDDDDDGDDVGGGGGDWLSSLLDDWHLFKF